MCFSAEVSFVAAAVLLPVGAASLYTAYQRDRQYMPLCALPLLFGLQQLMEGFVWTSGAAGNMAQAHNFSVAYMFFSWLAWPVWVPFSVYFLERGPRKVFSLVFAILGGILGGALYFPYLIHDSWLQLRFLGRAISYEGVVLFDFLFDRSFTHAAYLILIITPPLFSRRPGVRLFGGLLFVAFAATYLFFSFAYISAFCFFGAVVSLYLLYLVRKLGPSSPVSVGDSKVVETST
jgi:hypothetical protein